ncbi:MAG: hypothetical protein H6R45_471 [Proteobacteria bacterium]|nr:hypothetical protein [Pseudomonadota bacterium]
MQLLILCAPLLALEIDFRALSGGREAAEMLGQPLGIIERARAADIMLHQRVEFGLEGGIGLGGTILRLEVEDQRHQRLGDIASAELAEVPALVGQGAK